MSEFGWKSADVLSAIPEGRCIGHGRQRSVRAVMPGWSGSGTAGRGCGEGVVRSTRTAISPRVLTGASPQEGQYGSQGASGKGFSSGSTPAAGGGGRSWYVADLGYPGFTYLMRRSRELDCQTREPPSREGSAASSSHQNHPDRCYSVSLSRCLAHAPQGKLPTVPGHDGDEKFEYGCNNLISRSEGNMETLPVKK